MKNDDKKPRKIVYRMNTDRKVGRLSLNKETGEIRAFDINDEETAVNFETVIFHDRDTGKPKLIETIPGFGSTLCVHSYRETSKYDEIIVVDTNKLKEYRRIVSCCCFVRVKINEKDDYFSIDVEDRINFFKFVGVKGNPELLSIYKICVDVSYMRYNKEERNVLIVTDTELSKHQQFNSRKKLIYKKTTYLLGLRYHTLVPIKRAEFSMI